MNKYWFRKRRGLMSKDLGYGWVPISWEGWLMVVLLFVTIIMVAIVFTVTADNPNQSSANLLRNGITYLVIILVLIGLFTYIAHKKTQS